jgi:hypothetical protein
MNSGPDDPRPAQPDLDELRADMRRALAETDPIDKLLEIAGVITKAMADYEVEPVVVGGLAVAYWSGGQIVTGDIDFVMPSLPGLEQRIAELGFVREGRQWVYPGTHVSLEIPDQSLEPGDESELITTKSGARVRLITLEDMVLWRVREFLHWKAVRGFQQALYLLGHPRLDHERLRRRAHEEELSDALEEIWQAKQRVEAGQVIESHEIHDAAKRLNKSA